MTPTQIADALVAASANTSVSTTLDRSRLQLSAPLAPYTTFRIGGPADVLFDARTADELATAISTARQAGIPWFVLGLGANVLIGDRGIRGLVIRNAAAAHTISPEGKLWTESGAVMQDLVLDTVRAGWSGLEHYIGIPSTVGGALWQNLHFLSPAPERERTMFIAEVFERCEILAEEGDRKVVDAGYIKFGYDDTVFHHRRDVVLSATFQLTKADPAHLHQILQENLSWRGSRHPWLQVHPSAGSIFKKIEGVGAGRLIDQCGLKGFRVGDAQISHIHANILVNLGHATAADVRALVAHAQAAVKERFGYELQPEVGFIGEF
jgi:UDP-N-acetylmuramate dehydrogenase